MENRSRANITKHTKLTHQLIRHHFPKKSISVEPLSGGLINYVYAVKIGKDEMVVRISDQPENIHLFLKEQWPWPGQGKKNLCTRDSGSRQ